VIKTGLEAHELELHVGT